MSSSAADAARQMAAAGLSSSSSSRAGAPPLYQPTHAALLPFQESHVAELLEILLAGNRALDASDTGVGKTYNAIVVAMILGLRPFITCPFAAIPGWIEVAAAFGVKLLGIANYESLKNGKCYMNPSLDEDGGLSAKSQPCPFISKVLKDGTIVRDASLIETDTEDSDADDDEEYADLRRRTSCVAIAADSDSDSDRDEDGNVDQFAKMARDARKKKEQLTHIKRGKFDFKFDFPDDAMLIFDEAHRMKNTTSVNSKLLVAASKLSNKVLLLSATLTDKIKTFKVFGSFFGLYDETPQFQGWMRRQLKMLHVKHEASKLDENQKKLDAIHHSMKSFMRRINKYDLIKQGVFPEEEILAQCYDLPEAFEIQKLYEELKDAFEELKDKESRAEALAKLVRIRQKIEILKVPLFVARAKEELAKNRSVVITCNFVATMEQLQSELNCDCVIHGEQTMVERQFAIRQFQSNKAHVIIVNIQSGGVALSLHDLHGRQRVALHNQTWSGVATQQAFGRIHRANGKSKAIQYLLYCAKTYEERIAELINEKLAVMAGINDGKLSGTRLSLERIVCDSLGATLEVSRDPDDEEAASSPKVGKSHAKRKAGAANLDSSPPPPPPRRPFRSFPPISRSSAAAAASYSSAAAAASYSSAAAAASYSSWIPSAPAASSRAPAPAPAPAHARVDRFARLEALAKASKDKHLAGGK